MGTDVYVLVVIVVLLVVVKYTQYTRDVPLIYLENQSQAAPTRLSGESAVYKSAKLGMGSMRVGLDIRYDHYKIRPGNLRDIWALRVKYGKCQIGGDTVSAGQLNAMVALACEQMKGRDSVTISLGDAFSSVKAVAVMMAAFVSQVTVVIDSESEVDQFSIDTSYELDEFDPAYSPDADKGIALRVITPSKWGTTVVEYTQLNLVSAVASTLLHLPSSVEWRKDDLVSIVYRPSTPEHFQNVLCKWLTSAVVGCDVWVGNGETPKETTISSIPEPDLINLSNHASFGYILRLVSYGLGKQVLPGKLRLVYTNRGLTSDAKCNSEQIRARLGCRIISEGCYHNIIGPVVLTDVFDYRKLKLNGVHTHGGIAQSLEIKLGNYDGQGTLMIRGYTIGKTTLLNRDDIKEKNSDGFMPISVRGKWGSDGCLYIVN